MRIGKTTYRFVFRGTDPEQHRLAQDRFKVAAWLSLIVGLIVGAVAAVNGATVLGWLAVITLANGLLAWLGARVPPKPPPRDRP